MYFDIDAHRNCFKTKESEAYFWHGQTNDVGGPNNAMEIADKNHGKTLEKCMLDNRAELEKAGVRFRDLPDKTVDISYGSNQIESNKFWDDCSKAFAEQSSGNVHVVEGTDIRPNGQSETEYPSVYNRIEHPTLEQNQQVNSITKIDAQTRQPTEVEYFSRSQSNSSASESQGQSNHSSTDPITKGGGANAPNSNEFNPTNYIPPHSGSNHGTGMGAGIE